MSVADLLVKTGKFQPSDLELDIKPFGIIDSIKGLPEWWRSQQA